MPAHEVPGTAARSCMPLGQAGFMYLCGASSTPTGSCIWRHGALLAPCPMTPSGTRFVCHWAGQAPCCHVPFPTLQLGVHTAGLCQAGSMPVCGAPGTVVHATGLGWLCASTSSTPAGSYKHYMETQSWSGPAWTDGMWLSSSVQGPIPSALKVHASGSHWASSVLLHATPRTQLEPHAARGFCLL